MSIGSSYIDCIDDDHHEASQYAVVVSRVVAAYLDLAVPCLEFQLFLVESRTGVLIGRRIRRHLAPICRPTAYSGAPSGHNQSSHVCVCVLCLAQLVAVVYAFCHPRTSHLDSAITSNTTITLLRQSRYSFNFRWFILFHFYFRFNTYSRSRTERWSMIQVLFKTV